MTRVLDCDVAILGAGTAGLFAMGPARRAGKSVLVIDPGPLGTTCARVGCMPSKAALHTAQLWADRKAMAEHGVLGIELLRLDRDRAWAGVRAKRDLFTDRTEGNARKALGEGLIEGRARFIEPTRLAVDLNDGGSLEVKAGAVIIATGSRPVRPDWLAPVAERVITTDELFDLDTLPDAIGVLGLGAIGLEMGLAFARMGIHVVGADVASVAGGLTDPQIAERVAAQFGAEFPLWLGETASLQMQSDGVLMSTSQGSARVDLLLAALGRRPNTDGLNLAAAGFELDDRGVPRFNPHTLQVGDWPVFIAGDASQQRPLMHEAGDEGSIAGFNAAHGPQAFLRRTPIAIAFTHPDIAVVGANLTDLNPDAIVIGTADGATNGRSVILGAQSNLLRVYADADSGRLLGAAMMMVGGEHLAHLLAWSIQRGDSVQDLLAMPFYHPVLEEVLQSALQDAAAQLSKAGSHKSQTPARPNGLIPAPRQ